MWAWGSVDIRDLCFWPIDAKDIRGDLNDRSDGFVWQRLDWAEPGERLSLEGFKS